MKCPPHHEQACPSRPCARCAQSTLHGASSPASSEYAGRLERELFADSLHPVLLPTYPPTLPNPMTRLEAFSRADATVLESFWRLLVRSAAV